MRAGAGAGAVVSSAYSTHIHADSVLDSAPEPDIVNISLCVRGGEGGFVALPGSHIGGRRSVGWKSTSGSITERWIKRDVAALHDLQQASVQPGDAVLFHPAVLHGIEGPRCRRGPRRIARAALLLTGYLR